MKNEISPQDNHHHNIHFYIWNTVFLLKTYVIFERQKYMFKKYVWDLCQSFFLNVY